MKDIWKESYKKSREERIEILKDNGYIDDKDYEYLMETKTLTNEISKVLSENQISIYSLPYGLATNFLINDEEYVIPMAVEEPSVIAAACNAAKLIKKNGGFKASIKERLVIGQICIYDILDLNKTMDILKKETINMIKIANASQKNLVDLGGGAKKIKFKVKDEFLIIYLYVNALDAMGANSVNTMLESISAYIRPLLDDQILMSIISNYSTSSIVKASCEIQIDEQIGKRIEKAIKFANIDKYRAVTNNKGIFNGISSLAIATGNDYRAIEAGGHAYAVKNGRYKSLTKWEYKNGKLYGSIELPLAIATFGGCININETAKISLKILKNPDAKKLAMISASLGLAQNFAALKALISDGIQKGHMKLQIKTFATYLGFYDKIDEITEKLKDRKHISIDDVKEVIKKMK